MIITGKITITRNKYGFVTVDTKDDTDADFKDIFIPAQDTLNALSGDQVEVIVTDPFNKRGPCGAVSKVLKRARSEFIGQVIEKRNRKIYVKPISKSFKTKVLCKILEEMDINLEVEDWVHFHLVEPQNSKDFELRGLIDRKLTSQTPLSGILDSIQEEYNLPALYSPEDELASSKLKLRDIDRKDFTKFFTATIDPVDAGDFDDALSIIDANEKEVKVGIHIADVAAYVAPGSYFNNHAVERCFTNYLPSRMIPMLPKPLLRERCSLTAGDRKPAHSVIVTIKRSSGAVVTVERCHSWVEVDKRLNYQEVQGWLDSQKISSTEESEAASEVQVWDSWSDEVKQNLEIIHEVSLKLQEKRRASEHFIEIFPNEIRVLCGGEPATITELKRETHDHSHIMVEEYMLLANSLVAEEMLESDIPALYRIHPAPEMESIIEFTNWCSAHLEIKSGSLKDRKRMNQFLRKFDPEEPSYNLLALSFLKMMQRAAYSEECSEHYGLGKERYLHFTSPIRRYPDLLVHQQLWAMDREQELPYSFADCHAIGGNCTAVESNFDLAWRDADERLKVLYIYNQFVAGKEVIISSKVVEVKKSEMVIYLNDLGLFFTVYYSTLNQFFKFDPKKKVATGSRTGHTYAVGDNIQVEVSSTNYMDTNLSVKLVD